MGARRIRRLMLAALAVGAVLSTAPADSHPGHGPAVIAVGTFQFAPTQVNVVVGDYVYWDYRGPDTNHSVTSDPGQAVSFDSDPGKSPDQVSHAANFGYYYRFSQDGAFTFHCKVHSFMTGTVVVSPAPPGSGPSTPVVATLTGVTAKPSHFRARGAVQLDLFYSVNQALSIRTSLHRFIGAKRVGPSLKEIDFAAPPGSNRQHLSLGSLGTGLYRLEVIAVDNSTGAATAPADVSFRVRR